MAEISFHVWIGLLAISFLAAPLALLGIGHIANRRRHSGVSLPSLSRLHQRAHMFEQALASAPVPLWVTDGKSRTVWQNQTGRVLRDQNPEAFAGDKDARVSLPSENGSDPRWFEVQTARIGDLIAHYAPEITNEVRAENARRNFLQTLTKTFANLTTGLVVFDKNRQLALFNPALLDHTGLSAEFLSARPSLMSFFDQLRNRQVMPEPKNYATWRAQINEVVETAADGLYQETWSLPGGTVLRVSGRPHPDGAVAFLFEDISADISLTRGFRAQLEMLQHGMDALDTAIAIIGSNDTVAFCNKACRAFLQIDPDATFAAMSAGDLVRICDDKLPGNGFWQVAASGDRNAACTPVIETLPSPDGGRVTCQITPLSPDMTMLSIHHPASQQLVQSTHANQSGALAS